MFDSISARARSKIQTIGQIARTVIFLYVVGLLIHIAVNRWLHRSMVNEGLVFWSALGTVIAAVIASIYGSSYAFELNRKKELDARRKMNLEAGRWTLVVLASHVGFLVNLAMYLNKQKDEYGWELRMKKIRYKQELLPFNLEELRFLAVDGGTNASFLIKMSISCAHAFDLKDLVTQWNEKREECNEAITPVINREPSLIPSPDASLEEQKVFVGRLKNIIGIKLASESTALARTLVGQCDYGIRILVELFDGLESILKVEFPESKFTGIDKDQIVVAIGKSLWN